ncbi:MAG: lytic transglycosylase domain-containing protein [Gammaproteobacteria bacterium]|nr:lytic transglycosylase domain-containing protein [Gammaproteobacteria bacterium]
MSLHHVIVRESAKDKLELAFVAAVMQVESNFDVCAVSRASARGIMQLMPATARELRVRDIFAPETKHQGQRTVFCRGVFCRGHAIHAKRSRSHLRGPTVRKKGA